MDRHGQKPPENPPLIIEFFGLPGAGKSTIAAALHKQLTKQGVEAIFSPDLTFDQAEGHVKLLRRISLIITTLPRTLRYVAALLGVARVQQCSLRDRLKSIYTVWTVLSLYEKLAASNRSAVIDQGILQAIWSLSLCAPRMISRQPSGFTGLHPL